MIYKNPFSLEGKVVLVTGASSGIGRGVAVVCSQLGGTVILNGRDENRLKETQQMLCGEGHTILRADLTIPEQRAVLADSVPALDGIVHSAGVPFTKMCKQIEAEDLDYVMSINFNAPVLLQKELLVKKKFNRKASIIFVSSLAITRAAAPGNSVYSASKGALTAYADCLQRELASRLIRVNTILPAMVWTDLVNKSVLTEEDYKTDEQQYLLKRYGKPEDVANLVAYLLSDASEWMAGSHIEISGGYK